MFYFETFLNNSVLKTNFNYYFYLNKNKNIIYFKLFTLN